MNPRGRLAWALGAALLTLGVTAPALADETDNVTCRAQVLRDSAGFIDAWVNARVRDVVERANAGGADACDGGCLVRSLREDVGGSVLHPLTLIPHSRLGRRVETAAEVDRCHVAFGDSIYGARPYNQPWLFPLTGRVIFLADSIRLSRRVVGIDKINHFIREGLEHWTAIEEDGETPAQVLARELGDPARPLAMTEYGLKGQALTGVVSYADLAAGYAGYHFWRDLLSLGSARSYVARDETGRYAIAREFHIAAYVTDAWDEGLNPSAFHPALARQVSAALEARMLTLPVAACTGLAVLPDAELYVNPACLAPAGGVSDRATD